MTQQRIELKFAGELGLWNLPIQMAQWQPVLRAADSREAAAVRVDLSRVSFVTPTAAVALAALLSHVRKTRTLHTFEIIRPTNAEVDQWLSRIDFYSLIDLAVEYPFNRWNSDGRFKEIVSVRDERAAELAVDKLYGILQQQPNLAERVASQVASVLGESLANVFHHAEAEYGALFCAQTYSHCNAIEFAVGDVGQGVARSLSRNPAHRDVLDDPVKALERAMMPRATGRPDHNSGWGLKWGAGAIQRNRGEMLLYSGQAAYRVTSEGGQVTSAATWPGTLVAMRFRTDRPLMLNEVMNDLDPKGTMPGGLFEPF